MSSHLFDYTSIILQTCLSGGQPRIFTPPVEFPWEVSCNFVLKQFKALRQMGVDVDTDRVRPYFFPHLIIDLELLPPVVRSRDDRPRIFIDFQGSVEKPLEMVAMLAYGINIEEVKLFMGRNRHPTVQEKHDVKYVHGLLQTLNRGTIKRHQMQEGLFSFILEKNPVEIVIQRHDCRKFLRSFKARIVEVTYRKWRHRPAHYAHHAAYLAKTRGLVHQLEELNRHHKHSNWCAPKQILSIGDKNKSCYGHQCSVYNVYELMLWYQAPPETKEPVAHVFGF